MPRDSNGNYSLPTAGNPVITGTVVSSTWANATLNDVATVLTNSLDRSGNGGMLATLKIQSGSASAPGIAFTLEPSTGFYRVAANSVALSIGGTPKMSLNSTAFTLSNLNATFATPVNVAPTLSLQGIAGSATLSISSGNTTQATSDILVQRTSTGSGGVGQGAGIQLYDNSENSGTIFQHSTNYGAQIFVFNAGSGWEQAVSISCVGEGMYIYPPYNGASPSYPSLTVNGGNAAAVMQVVSTITSAAIPTLSLVANNANGQVALGFYSNGSLQFFIRADNAGNATYQSGGSHQFYLGATLIMSATTAGVVVSAPSSGHAGLYVNAVSGTHSTVIEDSAGNAYNAGYLGIPQGANPSANYTFALTDRGKSVTPAAGSLTFTIPNTSSVAFSVGDCIQGENFSGGNLTITPAAGVGLTWIGSGASGARTIATAGKFFIRMYSTNSWVIEGVNIS